MKLSDLLAAYRPGSQDPPWSWGDEAHDLHFVHPCPTTHAREWGVDIEPCPDPEPGCYQRRLEEYLAEVGAITQPVCLGSDGRVWDGHHRIVAAMRLGFDDIPVED